MYVCSSDDEKTTLSHYMRTGKLIVQDVMWNGNDVAVVVASEIWNTNNTTVGKNPRTLWARLNLNGQVRALIIVWHNMRHVKSR